MSKIIIVLLMILVSCIARNNSHLKNQTQSEKNIEELVGGPCDGCELIYIGIPENISSIDTNSSWVWDGEKLIVSGSVYELDGKTKAPNVLIYYWQTDKNGYYTPSDDMPEKAKRHGKIRGWVKSDENGDYSFLTTKPAPYPNSNNPAHIHLVVKEQNINTEYYIDDILFEEDKLLTAEKRNNLKKRSGSGITKPYFENGILFSQRDIILGLNIPNYPIQAAKPTKD